MYSYNLHQWLLFFFIYCFLGWVWESCYVSVKEHHWTNRGFLNGPFLPIYGSGALAILIATLPVRNTPVLVYVFGLIGATLLELVTGMVMENLFHVKYWDYSYQKFNYKGYICLTSSIAWGFFSLAMIYGIHKPIERMVLQIPEVLLQAITLLLTIIVAGDFAVSFKTAMELRDIIDAMNHMKEEMNRMQKRVEIVEAILADEANNRLEEMKENASELKDNLKESATDLKDNLKENATELKDNLKESASEFKESLSDSMSQKKDKLSEDLSMSREKAEEELRQLKEKQEEMKESMKRMMNRGYRSSRAMLRMLLRNPSASSKHAKESFLEYKEKLKEYIIR